MNNDITFHLTSRRQPYRRLNPNKFFACCSVAMRESYNSSYSVHSLQGRKISLLAVIGTHFIHQYSVLLCHCTQSKLNCDDYLNLFCWPSMRMQPLCGRPSWRPEVAPHGSFLNGSLCRVLQMGVLASAYIYVVTVYFHLNLTSCKQNHKM